MESDVLEHLRDSERGFGMDSEAVLDADRGPNRWQVCILCPFFYTLI
jgi:hypothetical protein